MRKRILAFLSILMVATLVALPVVNAAEVVEPEEKDVTITDDVNDDLYVSAEEDLNVEGEVSGDLLGGGGTVSVDEMVGGNAFLAGGLVNVNNKIGDNLFVAGGEVEVNETVDGMVLVAGGTVEIKADVKGDIIAMGGQITVSGLANDDVRVFGGRVELEGDVYGDVIVAGGMVEISGDVYGDIHLSAGTADISSDMVRGDIVTYGNTMLDLSDSTEVGGERIEKAGDFGYEASDKEVYSSFVGFGVLGFIWMILQTLGLIVLGAFVMHVAPIKFENVVKNLKNLRENGMSFLVGCGSLIVAIPVGIILLLSVVGWQLLAMLTLLFIIASMMATVFAGAKLGNFLLGYVNVKSKYLGMALGVLLINLLGVLPIVGWLVSFVVYFLGLGAVVRMLYQNYKVARMAKK